MNPIPILVCSTALLVAGCSTHVASSHPRHDGPQSPLVVVVEEVSRTEGAADVRFLLRKATTGVAAAVEFEIPTGVFASATNTELAADFTGERALMVHLTWPGASQPSSDLRVTASMRGAGFRATAVGSYRFGRVEAPVAAVATVPLEVQVGALRLAETASLERADTNALQPSLGGGNTITSH